MSRGERGQSMVEYLVISLPILLALLALAGPIRTMIGSRTVSIRVRRRAAV